MSDEAKPGRGRPRKENPIEVPLRATVDKVLKGKIEEEAGRYGISISLLLRNLFGWFMTLPADERMRILFGAPKESPTD